MSVWDIVVVVLKYYTLRKVIFILGAISVEHKHFKLVFDYEHNTNIDIMHGEINYFWSRNIVAFSKLKKKSKKTRKKINNFQ